MASNSRLIIFFILLITIFSCAEEADVPVFVTINQPSIIELPGQGSSFHDINEYFLFHRTSLLGGFSYGNEIPVLASGMEEILLFPGIRKNGLVEQPDIYQMMTSDTLFRNFIPGELIDYTPTFRYKNNVNFSIVENFEGGHGFAEDVDQNPGTQFRIENNTGYNNSTAGIMEVTEENLRLEVAWFEPMSNLPQTGDIIVELTHKNNIELGVGILANSLLTGQQIIYKVILFPSSDWNKVYIDLAPEIRSSGAEDVRLLIGVTHNLSDTLDVGRAWIDDVKLLFLN